MNHVIVLNVRMTSMNENDFGSILHIFIYAMIYKSEGEYFKSS